MATDNKRDLSNVNFQDVPSTIELPLLLGTTKDVYISIRTDGEDGSGTQLDPLDGSTADKLDDIFLSYAAVTYVHFHLGPGTFQTNVITRTWRIKVGWWIEGSGMYVTILQAIGSQAAFFQTQVLGDDQSASGSDYATVSDLTLDCNSSVVGASVTVVGGQKDYKISPARIVGTQVTLLRVRGINQYGSLVNARESWGISIAATTAAVSINNLIKDCIVEQPAGYGTPFGLFGYNDTFTCSGVVDNCLGIGINDGLGYASTPITPFVSGGLNIASVKNVTLQNSTFIDCESIIHHDTGIAEDVRVINNTAKRAFYGISSNNATRWVVKINKIELQLRNGNQANYGIVFLTTGTDVEILGNTVTTVAGGSGTDTFIPIYIGGITNPKLISNTVPNYACTFTGNTNGTILGNRQSNGSIITGLLDNVPTFVNLNSAAPATADAGTVFQYAGADSVATLGLIDGFAMPGTYIARRANNTNASKTTVVSGNVLAVFGGRGYNGTAYSTSARAWMQVVSAETWTTLANGAYLDFETTPLGSVTSAIAARVQPSGGLSVGTAATALTDPGNGIVFAGKAARIIAVTFANAVSSPTEGTIQPFTDSSTASIGGVITGGGANHVIGYFNGTNWVVIGGSGVGTSATIETTSALLKGDGAGNAIAATQTGSGLAVLQTGASLITPAIGVASVTTLNKVTINAPATAASFTFGADNCDYTFPEIDCNIGFREIPQNLKSADYTLVAADNGKEIHHPASDNVARVFTIPANASVAFPIGTVVVFTNLAATSCTVPITSDTMTLLGTGTTGTRTIAQYGNLIARKVASTAWVCSGTGIS